MRATAVRNRVVVRKYHSSVPVSRSNACKIGILRQSDVGGGLLHCIIECLAKNGAVVNSGRFLNKHQIEDETLNTRRAPRIRFIYILVIVRQGCIRENTDRARGID